MGRWPRRCIEDDARHGRDRGRCPHVYGNVVFNAAMMVKRSSCFMPASTPAKSYEHAGDKATMFEGVPTMYTYTSVTRNSTSSISPRSARCTVGGQTMPVAKMQTVEERFVAACLSSFGHGPNWLDLARRFRRTAPTSSVDRHRPPACRGRGSRTSPTAATMARGEVGELMIVGPIGDEGIMYEATVKRSNRTAGYWPSRDHGRGRRGSSSIAGHDHHRAFKRSAEIERVIAADPAVAMVAVQRADEFKGEIAKAYVVLKPGVVADAAGILSDCREQMAADKAARGFNSWLICRKPRPAR